jgi:hypothetical protein
LVSIVLPLAPHLLGCKLDRAEDAGVGGAPAEVAGERIAYLRLGRMRVALE